LLAMALLAIAAWAPFSTSWHEASVRHVRCAEHGELTHVAVISEGAAAAPSPEEPSAAMRLALKGRDAGTAAGHDHCAVAFVVQGGAQTPTARTAVRITPPAPVPGPAIVAPPVLGRAFRLATAPKTSPPVA
jgi:hypothetical protein